MAESERSTAAKNASLPQLDLFQFAWKIANTDPSERDGLLEDFISEARVLCAEEWKYIHGEDE